MRASSRALPNFSVPPPNRADDNPRACRGLRFLLDLIATGRSLNHRVLGSRYDDPAAAHRRREHDNAPVTAKASAIP